MFDKLQILLQAFADSITKTITETAKQFNKDATGSTIQSLNTAIRFDVQKAVQISVTGSKAFEYIEEGRPAGAKMPPQGALLDWMQSRGIPEAAEFAVRKSIAIKGIAPTPLISTAFDSIQKDFKDKVAPQAVEALAQGLINLIRKGFEFNRPQ